MAERLACDLAAQGLVIISGIAFVAWRAASTPPAIGARSRQKARRSRRLAQASTSSIARKTRDSPSSFWPRAGDLRISSGNLRCAAEFPHPQPDHQRHVGGCSRGGSRGIFRPRAIRHAARSSRITPFSPCPATSPTRIHGNRTHSSKQGAKLVATWEDVWEDLPAELRLALTPPTSPESSDASSASLFPDEGPLLTKSES
jgi:DNA processing protein